MSLPGKLCIGILEEDNPLKSYFRFKPLLIEKEGQYEPFEDGQAFPEEGCIRIVPDKNESSHFKVRMRRMGLFGVVDLTAHPNENDKIRPNKNYHGDAGEQNANIIYSDVVREPADHMIYEIIDALPEDGHMPRPNTEWVLLRKEGAMMGVKYGWQSEGEGENVQYVLNPEGEDCDISDLQVFDILGFRDEVLHFAVRPSAMIAQAVQAAREAAEENSETPKVEEAPTAQTPEKEKSEVPAPEEMAANQEKPWISRDASMIPPPIDKRLSPMQRLMAAQTGLNPRRGRNLQELIEDKWQQSRLNQLGHSVAGIVTGDPVINPVQQAVEAVRNVWSCPEMRTPLMESLCGIEEFGITLRECREIVRKSIIENQLSELEAQRLKMLSDLEELRRGRETLRAQLKQEIRRDEAKDLADAIEKTEAAKAVQADYEMKAEQARAAVKSAQALLETLSNGELERKLCEFANNSRILEQLKRINERQAHTCENEAMVCEKVDLRDFVARLQRRFEAEGWEMDGEQAANLATCMVLDQVMVLTGPAGSGKSALPGMLADALGWKGRGRFTAIGPGKGDVEDRLKMMGEGPAMLLLDDANTLPGDPLRGVTGEKWQLCLSLQDAGHPVQANLLDRGFTLRLSRPASDARWQPANVQPWMEVAPADLKALRDEARKMADEYVPETLNTVMENLRRLLAEHGVTLSRRTLDDTWYYCGAMNGLLQGTVTVERIFDRAVAQRILPALLASAPIEALVALKAFIKNMPHCQALLTQPLPIVV